MNVWTELQDKSVLDCQNIQRCISNDNYGICMFNVRLSGNVGMALRTACTMGFGHFVICGRHHYDKRFTVGAHNYINIDYWEDPVKVTIKTIKPGDYLEDVVYSPNDFIEKCQEVQWTPVFIEQGGQDIRYENWKLIERPLLVFGNESIGIPRSFMNEVKNAIPETRILSIPQWSILRSMNVANAASIAMWELKRRNQIDSI
jgi:tRNA G18 (ribose-2'-O)-methylase SpoU